MPPRLAPPHPARRLVLGLLVASLVLGAVEGLMRCTLGPPPPPVRVFGGLDQVDRLIEIETGPTRGGDAAAATVRPVFQERALGAPTGGGGGGDPGAGGQAVPMPFPVQPRAPRAIVIGGSSVHGGNGALRLSQEFPQLLDALAGVEVRNLGAPAMDSFELVRLTEQLAGVPHDLLVVYTGHNDYANTWFQGRFGDLAGSLDARASALLGRLQLYTQLRRLLRPPTGSPVPLGPSARHTPQPGQLQAATDSLERNLRRITWLSRRRGIPVVLITPVSDLLIHPLAEGCDGSDCANALWTAGMHAPDPATAAAALRRARDLDGVPLRAPSEAAAVVRRVATATGAILVDAEALLPRDERADVPASTLFLDPVHFSARGHEAMAALLRPSILSWLTADEGAGGR